MAFRFEDTGTQTAHGLTLNNFSAESAGAVNSYARVTAINGNQITINREDILYGAYEDFSVGVDILFHVSATAATMYKTYLGCYCVATITNVENSVLYLDKDVTQVLPADEIGRYYVQVVTIARFQDLTLASGVQIVPPAYSTTHFYGGIVAIKCFGNLNLSGGHINLVDRGLPVSATSMRPITTQESMGTKDVDFYAGWENSQTHQRFLLNCGDGAAFILVRGTLNVSNVSSRIGNPYTTGAQFCRGASDSVGDKPQNITNIGGSTILIAAQNINNFKAAIIAKYRASNSATGQGICRCYIASDSKLRNDEGLYSYDCISNPSRLFSELNIRNFGNGALGDVDISGKQLNNYARVVAISADRKTITYADKTTDGIAQITKGALVMIHATHRTTPNPNGDSIAENTGSFRLANVLADTGTTLTLDSPTIDLSPTTYAIQVISIPQFHDASVFPAANGNSGGIPLTPPNFDGDKGGIIAIACTGTLKSAVPTVKTDSTLTGTTYHQGAPYGAGGLRYIGNAQMYNRLPLGEGAGSAFILAKNIICANIYRWGSSSQHGENLGGVGCNFTKVFWDDAIDNNFPDRRFGGYKGVDYDVATSGSGAGGGKRLVGTEYYDVEGGYGSTGVPAPSKMYRGAHLQGAHVFVVADTLTNFKQTMVATGGKGLGYSAYVGEEGSDIPETYGSTGTLIWDASDGGAGYGGGGYLVPDKKASFKKSNAAVISYATAGGYNGGGAAGGIHWNSYPDPIKTYMGPGGASGWCFVYCNNAVNQDTTHTVLFD